MSEVFVEKKTNELIQLISVADAGDGYIRFSNGLQICHAIISEDTPNETIGNFNGGTVTFAMPFINVPSITLSRWLNDLYYSNEYRKEIHYSSVGCKSFIVVGANEADEAKVINFSYIAIGKWK